MKKIKTHLAAFLVLIAAGIMVACSSNSDGADLDTSTKATPLFDTADLTIPADDVELSKGYWVFKYVGELGRIQHSFTITNNLIYYTESTKEVLVQNFNYSNSNIKATSGSIKRDEIFDNENKEKYVNFLQQENTTISGESWQGNTLKHIDNNYTYTYELTRILSNTSGYTITTNEKKTRYYVTTSDNKRNYYFAKQ